VTGIIDSDSSTEFEELWQPGAAAVQITQSTYIFTEYTNGGMEDERKVPTLFHPHGPCWFTLPLECIPGGHLGDNSRVWI